MSKYRVKFEWKIRQEKDFSVRVVGWEKYNDTWGWNVYADIYPSHPMYGNNDYLEYSLPLHGGCTLTELKTAQPFVIKYDWQKLSEYKTAGSDYAHDGDYMDEYSPYDGIPYNVERNALELADELAVHIQLDESQTQA